MLNTLLLDEALKSVGVATVFVGDPMTTGGLLPLGITEGDITLDLSVNENRLTAPEYTGDISHQVKVTAGNISGTIPLIVGDEELWTKIMPTGVKGMGWSNQVVPQTQAIVIIPNDEIGSGLSNVGAVWTPAAPVNAFWIWKASILPGQMAFHFGDGGKVIMPCRFVAWFDATKPEEHKVLTIGDPVAAGIAVVL